MTRSRPDVQLGNTRRQAVGLGLAVGVLLVGAWLADTRVGPVVALAGLALGWLAARLAPRATPPAPAEPVVEIVPLPVPATSDPDVVSALRHDLRGILSPAMLIADRLQMHQDPAVQRAGEVVTRTVERAAARLAETRSAAGAAGKS